MHLLKLVHDKLPTNYNKAKYQPWISPVCHFCNQLETFNHLCLSNCNDRSITFRKTFTEKLKHYFRQTNAPTEFQTLFLDAVHKWYNGTEPHHTTNDRDAKTPTSLRQSQIGWNQMFKGFFTKAWRERLVKASRTDRLLQWYMQNDDDDTDPYEDSTDSIADTDLSLEYQHKGCTQNHGIIEATAFLSGIIKLLWVEMGTLWTTHLHHIHQSEATISKTTKVTELQAQIRAIHQLQGQTLAEHRTRYFFSNVEQYIVKATVRQMAKYIDRYRPVILHSVRQATKIATNSPPITTFQGFTPKTTTTLHMNHPAMEEEPHRKHTWMCILLTQRITTYFKKTKPTNPPP